MQAMNEGSYPVSLNGELDPNLSRWLWLVKWLLAIPHFVVLLFLWIAFLVSTIFAFFSILFTGRYPQGLFNFNVGVLRWNWRVAFYCLSVLGTDRYPPFSLKPADYPATLEIEYPERLSRGLVLVKWWLLAIPHYFIIAVLQGGGAPRFGGLNAVLYLPGEKYDPKADHSPKFDVEDDVRKWLKENVTGKIFADMSNLYFEKSECAVAFKLRWT